jgi:hypothetical protein
MQDDSHINTNPRDAGGKWKRQTTSAAETAKTALEAGSVSVKQGARELAEQQKQAGAEQIGGVARAVRECAPLGRALLLRVHMQGTREFPRSGVYWGWCCASTTVRIF